MTWATYRDQSQTASAIADVAHLLVKEPGLLSTDYIDRLPQHTRRAVERALDRLRHFDFARSEKQRIARTNVCIWTPTESLREAVANNRPIKLKRQTAAAPTEVFADEQPWKPGPWIHPIRARALGITTTRGGR